MSKVWVLARDPGYGGFHVPHVQVFADEVDARKELRELTGLEGMQAGELLVREEGGDWFRQTDTDEDFESSESAWLDELEVK